MFTYISKQFALFALIFCTSGLTCMQVNAMNESAAGDHKRSVATETVSSQSRVSEANKLLAQMHKARLTRNPGLFFWERVFKVVADEKHQDDFKDVAHKDFDHRKYLYDRLMEEENLTIYPPLPISVDLTFIFPERNIKIYINFGPNDNTRTWKSDDNGQGVKQLGIQGFSDFAPPGLNNEEHALSKRLQVKKTGIAGMSDLKEPAMAASVLDAGFWKNMDLGNYLDRLLKLRKHYAQSQTEDVMSKNREIIAWLQTNLNRQENEFHGRYYDTKHNEHKVLRVPTKAVEYQSKLLNLIEELIELKLYVDIIVTEKPLVDIIAKPQEVGKCKEYGRGCMNCIRRCFARCGIKKQI